MIRRPVLAIAAAAAIALFAPTHAFGSWKQPDPVSIPAGLNTVRLAGPAEASRLAAGGGWRDFTHRHPGWKAVWNEVTASPHRAFGPPIPLPAFVPAPSGVDRAVRAFVAGHPGVFGSPALSTVSVREVRGTWYVRYRQTVAELPVLFADWEFRVGRQGRLFAFGAHVQNVPPELAPGADRIGVDGARAAAIRDLPFDESRDRADDHGLAILPWENGHRLVRAVTVDTQEPRGSWLAFVDATNGELLVREDQKLESIAGVSSGTVHPLFASDTPAVRLMPDLRVFFGSNTRLTDSTGLYLIPGVLGSDTVRASLAGTYVIVKDKATGLQPQFLAPATAPAVVNVPWNHTNSDLAARDAFYNINRARAHIRTLDPLFTGLDYPLVAMVNAAGTCNAFYANGSITFYGPGDGCPNIAYLADIVFHEYGHALNQALYLQQGAPFGLQNTACHEATADVFSAFLLDDPVIGQEWSGPGTSIRTIDNARRWPEGDDPDPHLAGLILGGAFWDLRKAVGLDVARTLAHYCKYGLPDYRGDNGIAMNDFFFETVVADDDDSDLTNGTPHITAIADAFNAHGIGTGFWLGIGHENLADHPAGPGPFDVRATYTYTGPFGDLDMDGCFLHYQINGGTWGIRRMDLSDNTDELRARFAAPPEALIRYYFEARDTYGGTTVWPVGAPGDDTFEFLNGPTVTAFFQNMETDPGWTVGAPGDNATSGIWVRLNPNSTYFRGYLQPEDDHTPLSATRCWVTGDAPPTEGPGLNDVDRGRTSLTTMLFDATAVGYAPMVEYYRWFTNEFIDGSGLDPWRVQISNDAGHTWHDVEYTLQDAREWRRIIFLIQEFVTPTANMMMRFVATDEGDGTLIEAAMDDFRLLAFASPLAVPDAVSGPLAFAAPAPNPLREGASTRIAFTLPHEGPVRLAVMDVQGREVALLADGPRPAGPQSIEWDGRGSQGHRLAPGMYFLSLAAAESHLSRRIMLLE